MPNRFLSLSRWLFVPLVICFVLPLRAEAAKRAPPEVKGVVNLNTATEAELRLLPGVGPKKAERLVQHRAQHKFQSTDQIMKVKGFGRLTYRKLKPHLAVSGATTITRAKAISTKSEGTPPADDSTPPAAHDG